MVRFVLTPMVLLIALGSASAEQFRGTFAKYEGGVLTLKDGDKEKSFPIPTGMKMKVKAKLDTKDVSVHETMTKLAKSKNQPKMNVVYDVVKEKGKEKEMVRAVQFEP